jgi:hypothetical protein
MLAKSSYRTIYRILRFSSHNNLKGTINREFPDHLDLDPWLGLWRLFLSALFWRWESLYGSE